MEESLIYKHLTSQTTSEEESELLSWLEASSENKQLFFEIQAIWDARYAFSDKSSSVDLYNSLVGMNKRLDQLEAEKRKSKNLKRKSLIYLWGNIAAVILVAVFFLAKYAVSSNSEMMYTYTNLLPDSVKQIILKDGTCVWLATNATITYSGEYLDKERVVKLDGLAFFEVTKDASHPFIVKTKTFKVKVLGTSFAVNSDNANHKGEAVLLKGSVQFENKEGEGLIKMHPGQQVLYSEKSKSLEVNEIDAKTYTLWRFHLVSLLNVSIEEIVSSIEQTYKVQISIDSSDLKHHKYNFYYKDCNSLDDALEKLFYLTGQKATIIQ